MDIIKRLIIKDFIALKSYKRLIITTLVMSIIFTFLGFFDKEMEMVTYVGITLPISILGGLASSILYEEEKANSDSYILTFPVTKKDVVLGKYLFNISLIIVGFIIVLITSLICKIFLPLHLLRTLLLMVIFGSATNLLFVLKTPFVYKYGTEKANSILLILLFAILSILPVLFISLKSIDPEYKNTIDILNNFMPYIPIIGIILIILFNYISYRRSYKIYLKKEL